MIPGVVARSRSLAERLARPVGADADAGAETEAERVGRERAREAARRWREACARGDEALFARRLELAGLTEAEATEQLASSFREREIGESSGGGEEEWIRVLREASAPTEATAATATGRPVVESFVEVARIRLERRHASILESRMTPAARDDLLAILRERLAERVARVPQFSRAPLEVPAIPEEMPVLARDLARESVQWIAFVADFLQRLDEDAEALEDPGEDARAARLCTSIEGELSDRHCGGRTVLVVRFDSGPPIVFKPRDLGLEAAFHRLVGDLARMGAPPLPSPARVLIRPGGGWMEHVAREDCPDAEAARRHFQKAGALVALAYLLVGSDLHFENLVARGEDPVPVDFEMLLRPRPPSPNGPHRLDPERDEVRRLRSESVESTGLLPRIGAAKAGVPEASGLFAGDPPTSDVPPHRAALDGVPLAPADYAAEMEAGMRAMFEFALRERERLLAPDGPLEPLRRVVPRFAFRRSSLYAALLAESRDPSMLADGFERSLSFERLGRAVLDRPDWRVVGRMFLEEVAALERGDVPRFGVEPEECPGDEAFDAEFARTFDGVPLGRVGHASSPVPPSPPNSSPPSESQTDLPSDSSDSSIPSISSIESMPPTPTSDHAFGTERVRKDRQDACPTRSLPFFVESGWSRMLGRFASLSPAEIERQVEVLRASLRVETSRVPSKEDDACAR